VRSHLAGAPTAAALALLLHAEATGACLMERLGSGLDLGVGMAPQPPVDVATPGE